MNTPINLQSKFHLFSDHWSPKVIAEMNDYQSKIVKIKGQFMWHEHQDTDEVFLVIEGSMGIEFEMPPFFGHLAVRFSSFHVVQNTPFPA